MDNVGGDGDHKVGAPSFSTILKVATHDRQHVEGMVQGWSHSLIHMHKCNGHASTMYHRWYALSRMEGFRWNQLKSS